MAESVNGQDRYAVTKRVTIVGALVNMALAIVKIVFGLIGQSQSLLADGIHSLSDLLSDGLVMLAAYHAQEEPDENHPYGHGRFETMGAMGLGLLLILAAVGIIWDAQERLFSPETLLHPDSFTLYVALFSILANEGLYHYTVHSAKLIGSDLLRANAWHHRSDAVSSIVVMIGIGGTLAGLPYLDAIAAGLVGLMVIRIGWNLVHTAMQELVDSGLEQERVAHIREIILAVGGVLDVHMLRTRRLGSQASADVHVQVEPWLSVSEGHMISEEVRQCLLREIEELNDVTVHIDPEDDEHAALCKGLPLRREVLLQLDELWAGIPAYTLRRRIVLHYLQGQVHVDLILPLESFQNTEQTVQMKAELQQAIDPHQQLGRVAIYFD